MKKIVKTILIVIGSIITLVLIAGFIKFNFINDDVFIEEEITVSEEEDLPQAYDISFYSDNDSYFSKYFDINNDNVLDKIISSNPYQGDELLLFVSNNNTYELALKTINFSQDGGNQIVDIKKHENGFVIVTAFPDRGFFESHFYISFKNDHWILTNTIFKTMSSNQEDAFVYVCDVKQDIDISDAELLNGRDYIPDESDRDKTCLKIFNIDY